MTIRDVSLEEGMTEYTLGFPNLEVSTAFTNSLLDTLAPSESKFTLRKDLARALRLGEVEQFKAAIHALFAAIPCHNYTNNEIARYEGFYASVIFAWLSSIGIPLIVEDCTDKGRTDMSLEMDDTIYLIEFKVDIKINERPGFPERSLF